jgi:hypothetical protein
LYQAAVADFHDEPGAISLNLMTALHQSQDVLKLLHSAFVADQSKYIPMSGLHTSAGPDESQDKSYLRCETVKEAGVDGGIGENA